MPLQAVRVPHVDVHDPCCRRCWHYINPPRASQEGGYHGLVDSHAWSKASVTYRVSAFTLGLLAYLSL